ncbi:proline racemase family protein [Halarchaeum salinum]|uniref:Proline racemase n=1 Tax=Halarchaeum salinum TaxID=489912 RepID=A0AAV3S9J1_9EURY
MEIDKAFDQNVRTDAAFTTIDTHTGGEPTRIIVDAADQFTLAGDTVRSKRDSFAEDSDWVRDLLIREPRGHDDMFGAVVVEPEDDCADIAAFFMDSKGYLDMCGHGTIGVVSALIELGELSSASTVCVETPAGLVKTHPEYDDNGGVERVVVQNVDSFVYNSFEVPVSFLKTPLSVDVVYAGNFFVLVDSEQLSRPLETTYTDEFIEWGLEIRQAVNNECDIVDPRTGEHAAVAITEIYEHASDVDRSVVVFGDGQIDRSPCGTGTCAKMALLYEEGKLSVDQAYPYESIIGTRFEGKIVDSTDRNGTIVVTPTVAGSAYITGKHTFIKDSRDPLQSLRISGTEE